MLLRPLLDGMRSRFQVSVAEVAHQDTWQRADLGIALVSSDLRSIEKAADNIERFIWQASDTEVLQIDRHWLDNHQ